MIGATLSSATSRRAFLTALAAAGAASIVPSGEVLAAPAPRHHGVINVHHHFWAPEYLKTQNAWEDQHHIHHYPTMEKWSPQMSLEEMDKGGVKTAVLSLASISAGFWGLDGQAASRVVHAADDYAAKMMSDHPGRFGLFAPLNMVDVDLSLKEIEYAYDQIHAHGIGIQTSYNGKYPGDPMYRPILEELHHRKAVVFLHGPNPACCSRIHDGPGMFASVVEVTFDTTRAVASLLTSGSLARYRDIKWIVPYGGGTIPYVAGRLEAFVNGAMRAALKPEEIAPHGVFAELQRLHYDTVNVTEAPSWVALTKLVKPSQVLYGTDFPYFNNGQLRNIDKRGLSAKDKHAILTGNAARLMPRLAKA